MKTMFFLSALLQGAAVMAADPSVSSVSIGQLSNRLVKVCYTLSGDRAIVTPVFKIDGQPVDMSKATQVSGDIRRIVGPGERAFVWDPRTEWTEGEFDAERLSVDLTVWKVSAPPPKMVVDLDPMIQSSTSNVLYYVSEAELPGGIADERYRKTKLLMTLVPAANVRWRMGDGGDNSSKMVTLTQDFFISAFLFTQGQGKTAWNDQGTDYTTIEDALLCPMVTKYSTLRDSAFGPDPVPTGYYLDKLRIQTGLPFDLPSEFQWEYAARAGYGYLYETYQLNLYGWWGEAWGSDDAVCKGCTRKLHPVGRKRPNAFGLYDFIGNVKEFTRTRAKTDGEGNIVMFNTAEETDPEGRVDSDYNIFAVMRSGAHRSDQWGNQLYMRQAGWFGSPSLDCGFRVILPVEKAK